MQGMSPGKFIGHLAYTGILRLQKAGAVHLTLKIFDGLTQQQKADRLLVNSKLKPDRVAVVVTRFKRTARK